MLIFLLFSDQISGAKVFEGGGGTTSGELSGLSAYFGIFFTLTYV